MNREMKTKIADDMLEVKIRRIFTKAQTGTRMQAGHLIANKSVFENSAETIAFLGIAFVRNKIALNCHAIVNIVHSGQGGVSCAKNIVCGSKSQTPSKTTATVRTVIRIRGLNWCTRGR